jgi:F-type H+/Na+-transporting ATPase subunit alpha
MARFSRKIEDVLASVSVPMSASPQIIGKYDDDPPRETVSFPKILDFSFPQSSPDSKITQVGEVIYVGDGVCHVAGLDKSTIDETIQIKTQRGIETALILGIQEDRIEAVVLGDYSLIKRGDPAKSTNQKLKFPIGKATVGRVLNPLGQPLDGLGPINATKFGQVEFPAPGVVDRVPIIEPLHTGILNIDSTIPVGRGQRELVIGDRKTGKTRTMLDVISNQQDQKVYCIYVGIGMQAAKAKATYQLLEKRGALKYTTLIISQSDDPPPLQYLAPYAGAALGESYMYQGKHALVIYDDLSKQAKAYRQVSLLLKRSPGRDAYPGDIFFLHSRLLERASKLHSSLGGGSLTALPIAETQGGDISDYIITNLMSITDGHIYLDANMMHEGLMPAINSGASVSRIGGKVQSRLLQKVGELTSRTLARYEEVKSFETINTEVTADTMRDIKRGKRVREILAQDTDISYTPEEEIIILGIATSTRMDHFDPQHTVKFKTHIVPFLRSLNQKQIAQVFSKNQKIEAIDPLLDKLFTHFCARYQLPSIPSSTRQE